MDDLRQVKVTAEERLPHRGTHRPWMFICSMDDPDAAIVGLTENPADRVASALLEDVGDWLDAIKELKRTEVPAGVISTLHALHEAVCGWVDWDARTEKR